MASIVELQKNIKVLNTENLRLATQLNIEKKTAESATATADKVTKDMLTLQQEKKTLSESVTQLQTKLSRAKETDRTKTASIVKLQKNINVLNTENLKFATQLNIEKKTAESVKVTADKVTKDMLTLQQEKKTLSENVIQLQTELSDVTRTKQAVFAENEELKIRVQKFQDRVVNLEDANRRLQAEVEIHGESEDLSQEGFVSFISDTLGELEKKMQTQVSVDEDKKFVVKEMEIEAKVVIEKKGNKGVYVFPTAEKLKGIASDQLHRMKFLIKSEPKLS